jgi:hypothetical protein
MNWIHVKRVNAILLITISLFLSPSKSQAQPIASTVIGATMNALPVSVSFLTIAPDGRSSGMGDVGAASAPDVNSQHWNAAKYAFTEGKARVGVTYSPWLTNLVPNVWHLYLAGYYKISDKNIVSTSFRYLSLGTITFSGVGVITHDYHPREYTLDAGYARKFTDNFSGALVLRYIFSDPQAGFSAPPLDYKAGQSFAADLGLYYQKKIHLNRNGAQWALGINISNMGPPVTYSADAEGLPLPTNLRLGGRLTHSFNKFNSITFLADMNKLLVPTPPEYNDSIYDVTGQLVVSRGMVRPESVVKGMLQSFYDAPGILLDNGRYSTVREEFNEIAFGMGAEYWYKKRFAVRSGYFHEHATKGNRQYFTFGLGFCFRAFSWDLSYLLPRTGANSPLFNTFRISMAAEFGKTV